METNLDVFPLRPVKTVKGSATIWSKISEDVFRRNLVKLEEKTNAVPVDVFTANLVEENQDKGSHASATLPLIVEKQVTDDLAYLAAVTEGAQSVAAVCLEQHISNHHTSTLVVRVAGMDVVDERVKSMFCEISKVLQQVSSDAREREEVQIDSAPAEVIYRITIQQHEQKLLGRLRSKKWRKPAYLARTHKKSLWQDFENVIHRAQHVYPQKSERRTRENIKTSLESLRTSYEEFENIDESTQTALQRLVKSTYIFCQAPGMAAYAKNLEALHATPQIAAALKTLRQLEKIGAYWRISKSLVSTARAHSASFGHIQLEYITPYQSVPTDIAYEPWAKTSHVHAEIQLAVHYTLHLQNKKNTASPPDTKFPRTIGTSKYLCYLCHLFLKYHSTFQILNTHGRLYDQWTVPDLEEYSEETREEFSNVLAKVNAHVEALVQDATTLVWRPEPMTSRQNLLCYEQKQNEVEDSDANVTAAMEKLSLASPRTST